MTIRRSKPDEPETGRVPALLSYPLRIVGGMSVSAMAAPAKTPGEARWDEITEELAELCGQQNVITGRITELLAEVEDEGLLGGTGLRSLEHFATWQLGVSGGRARVLTAIARRRVEFPVTVGLLDTGLLSEDQAGVIARKAPAGTDEHYAELARTATVAQLRTALRAAPKSAPPSDDTDDDEDQKSAPASEPDRQVSAWWLDDDDWELRARLDAVDGALVDAALRAHLEALVAEWKREKEAGGTPARPFPRLRDALVRMAEHSLDAAAHLRPHGHRTTVVLHVNLDRGIGELHLGPALSEAERRYLSCDARVEVWFERDGQPIGVGRTTREIPRRLRRALEHRARGCCEVPGCDATQGLHAHHLVHWEDGGPTELWNLLLICPFHHRAHHHGTITIRGPAHHLHVIDHRRRPLTGASLARTPTTQPPPAHYDHPTGGPVDWRWYDPPSLC